MENYENVPMAAQSFGAGRSAGHGLVGSIDAVATRRALQAQENQSDGALGAHKSDLDRIYARLHQIYMNLQNTSDRAFGAIPQSESKGHAQEVPNGLLREVDISTRIIEEMVERIGETTLRLSKLV